MNDSNRGFSLVLVLIIVAIVGILTFVYMQPKGETTELIRNGKLEEVPGPVQSTRKTEGTITREGDWSQYTTSEWVGFIFSYPSSWVLTEKAYNPNVSSKGLSEVKVEGDGYTVYFTTIGKGLDTGVDTRTRTEVIAGHEVVFYYEEGHQSFTAVVKDCANFGGVLISRSGAREITDKIITSLKCQVRE